MSPPQFCSHARKQCNRRVKVYVCSSTDRKPTTRQMSESTRLTMATPLPPVLSSASVPATIRSGPEGVQGLPKDTGTVPDSTDRPGSSDLHRLNRPESAGACPGSVPHSYSSPFVYSNPSVRERGVRWQISQKRSAFQRQDALARPRTTGRTKS